VSWEEVERDWLQALAETAAEHRALFEGRRVGDVPALAADPTPLVAVLRATWPDEYADDEAARDAVHVLLGAALTVALVREGFTFDARLGGPISCRRGEHRFAPLSELAEIAAVDEGARLLSDRLVAAGVHDAPLAPTPGDRANAEPGVPAPSTSAARK
jgi:hypothetical protein